MLTNQLAPSTAPGASGSWTIWIGSNPCGDFQDHGGGRNPGACGIIFTVNPPSPIASQNGPWVEVVGLVNGTPRSLIMAITSQTGGTQWQSYIEVQQG